MGTHRGDFQGLKISGTLRKDGNNAVIRESNVTLDSSVNDDQQSDVKLGVRIGEHQDITYFKLGSLVVVSSTTSELPRDTTSEAQLNQLNSKYYASGERWHVWRLQRNQLPSPVTGFKTKFRLSSPIDTQTVMWAVVYASGSFFHGHTILGYAEVSWKKASRRRAAKAAPKRSRTKR